MTYRGRVHGGVVVIDDGATLPEGTAVTIEAPAVIPAETADDPLYRLAELAVATGVPDLAVNIDHYLYGHPKVHLEQP